MRLKNRSRLIPWYFAAPGLLWLLVFFLVPLLNQLNVSLLTGDPEAGYELTWAFSNYTDAISEYWPQIRRSLGYAGVATVIDVIIAFPLAYFIAYRAGRWKGLLLLMIVLPFFMSQVLRTVSWQLLLTDNGWIVSRLKDVGLVADDGRVLATSGAVIGGIAYNYLPFMVLPLYASLERLDRRLIEAATDLYASRAVAFRKITVPLATPGLFAGSLLVFIPATGDFINASLLGSTKQYMVGNVIQSNFLTVLDYPTAAALSFLLIGIILVGITIYSALLGTKNLTEAAG
ncbi:MAG: ABC transporter permease [Solirubrobacteraceae bacterium]|nr:ABC transporter permease [Solirubrobacteraceae bacterium]